MKRVRFLSEVRMKEEELDLRLAEVNECAEWLEMAEAEAREMRRSERLQSSEVEGERLRLELESLAEREKMADARISAAEKKEEELNSLQEAKMREIKLKVEELGKKSEEFAKKVRVWERGFTERIEFAKKKLDSLKGKMEFSSFQEEKVRDLALKEQLINSIREELVKDIEFRKRFLLQFYSSKIFLFLGVSSSILFFFFFFISPLLSPHLIALYATVVVAGH